MSVSKNLSPFCSFSRRRRPPGEWRATPGISVGQNSRRDRRNCKRRRRERQILHCATLHLRAIAGVAYEQFVRLRAESSRSSCPTPVVFGTNRVLMRRSVTPGEVRAWCAGRWGATPSHHGVLGYAQRRDSIRLPDDTRPVDNACRRERRADLARRRPDTSSEVGASRQSRLALRARVLALSGLRPIGDADLSADGRCAIGRMSVVLGSDLRGRQENYRDESACSDTLG